MPMLTRMRKPDSASAARFCAFPWPYGCPRSAGRTATDTAKNVNSAAARSVPECAASARRPRLELAIPATSLIATRRHAAPTETSAVRRCGDMRRRLEPLGASGASYPRPREGLPAAACARTPTTRAFARRCATPLGAEAPAREERKVVTCLFCDLVGFTARAETMDPEDVRRLLQPIPRAACAPSSSASAALSRSSSAMRSWPIFGAPIAHEDDPERAVRAALAIRETARSTTASWRSGSESRPARRSSPSTRGRRQARGWSPATSSTPRRASRPARPPGRRFSSTRRRSVRPSARSSSTKASSIDAKGKSQPVSVWAGSASPRPRRSRATSATRRSSDASASSRSCESTLARVVAAEREPQLVTLVGRPGHRQEPARLRALRDDPRPERSSSCTGGSGRSLPYGEGVTFWALGEIVKAQAGILESDPLRHRRPRSSAEPSSRCVSDPSDAGWVERHLRPLAGLDADETVRLERRERGLRRLASLPRGDRATSVRSCSSSRTCTGPTTLCSTSSTTSSTGRGASRCSYSAPLDRSSSLDAPAGAAGRSTRRRSSLSPLSEDETSIARPRALLGDPALETGVQERLLEHAGGNPLYAEEFARMLARASRQRPSLPETRARDDRRPPRHAPRRGEGVCCRRPPSSGGSSGSARSGASAGRSRSGCTRSSARSSSRRERRCSVAGEDEYAFRHALVRDVAYEQIPRARSRRRCTWQRRDGSSRSAGPRTTPRCSLTTTQLRSSTPGRRVRTSSDAARAARSRARWRGRRSRVRAQRLHARAARFYERAARALARQTIPDRATAPSRRLGSARDALADARGEDAPRATAARLSWRRAIARRRPRRMRFSPKATGARGQREALPAPRARVSTSSTELRAFAGEGVDSLHVSIGAPAARADDVENGDRICRRRARAVPSRSSSTSFARTCARATSGTATLRAREDPQGGFADLVRASSCASSLRSPEAITWRTSTSPSAAVDPRRLQATPGAASREAARG